MNLSEAGLERIKSYEAYKRELPDGSCTAYQDTINGKKDIPTIGWGCTEGVEMGMIWTRDEAETALLREIEKHEKGVTRNVSVDLNQNQRDALISLSYNIGSSALANSTLLKKLNKGDYAGAQAEFLRWSKFNGATSRGLSIRRASEAELFATRTEEEEDAKPATQMPQDVEPPNEPLGTGTKATLAGTGTLIGWEAGNALVSAPPKPIVDTVTNVSAWQSLGKAVVTAATFAWSSPAAMLVVAAIAIGAVWLPRMLGRSS